MPLNVNFMSISPHQKLISLIPFCFQKIWLLLNLATNLKATFKWQKWLPHPCSFRKQWVRQWRTLGEDEYTSVVKSSPMLHQEGRLQGGQEGSTLWWIQKFKTWLNRLCIKRCIQKSLDGGGRGRTLGFHPGRAFFLWLKWEPSRDSFLCSNRITWQSSQRDVS